MLTAKESTGFQPNDKVSSGFLSMFKSNQQKKATHKPVEPELIDTTQTVS